jgi:hypothetical protein
MSIPFSPSSFISNVFPPQSRVFAGWHRCMCWHRCMGWFPSTCSPPRRSSPSDLLCDFFACRVSQ